MTPCAGVRKLASAANLAVSHTRASKLAHSKTSPIGASAWKRGTTHHASVGWASAHAETHAEAHAAGQASATLTERI